jgi:hypothetical protein
MRIANRVADAVPFDAASSYVLETPRWLRTAMRLLMLAMGLALAVLSARDWGGMPFGARALVGVVAPSLALMALWPRPWRRMVKLVAGATGIAFPCNELLVLSLRAQESPRWLLVPWENISGIRLAREAADGNRCVAFDVVVSAEERERFFRHVDSPQGGAAAQGAALPVA